MEVVPNRKIHSCCSSTLDVGGCDVDDDDDEDDDDRCRTICCLLIKRQKVG